MPEPKTPLGAPDGVTGRLTRFHWLPVKFRTKEPPRIVVVVVAGVGAAVASRSTGTKVSATPTTAAPAQPTVSIWC